MRWKWALVVVAAVTVLAGPPATQSATRDSVLFFNTPSGNISCVYLPSSTSANLRCDIGGGVRPLPPKPRSCGFDWGVGMQMQLRARARIVCASDSVFSPAARRFPYGTTWRRNGFICTVRRVGLRCSNRTKNGFFLSRQRSYRF
jgi:uncharacterized protein DUF6636